MKKSLHLLFSFMLLSMAASSAFAQCNAQFAWEQIPNTLTVHFNNNSTSEQDIISNLWTFGDGGTSDAENPNHTFDEPGTYLVCLTIETEGGCEDDVCHEVTVSPVSSECNAEFTWEQIPGTLQIHFNSTSTSQFDITSYSWNFGDGDQGDGENPYHTYEEPGNYAVCLIITDSNGCVSDVCHEVTVAPLSSECNAQFTWEQIPNTLQIHFNSTSTSPNDIISYLWTFGDGGMSDNNDPYHTYDEPGVYLVCLVIHDSEGCVSDVCHEVTVLEIESECHANFTWEQFDGTYEVDFTSTSTSDHDIISFQWFFGDGSQGDGPNPSHSYDEPGVYNVCLVIENEVGCVSEECHLVTVEETSGECHAQFTWEQIPGTLQIHFNSTSTSEFDITSYQWNFGDGHNGDGDDPYHTYDEPGVYVVCLIITDASGCVSDICHEVHVEAPEGECHAQFTWEQIPGTLQIHFNSTSTSEFDIVSYSWQFGDGTEGDGNDPYHTYEEPGVYLVCLTITDASGCVSDVCHEVTVLPIAPGECNADFNWEQLNGSYELHFHSTSTSDWDIISYQWNYGDGHTSDGQNPYHTFDSAGTYLVCLIITDASGCVSDVCHEVTVEPVTPGECNAQFTWEQIPGTLQIHFNSTSTSEFDIVSYSWQFGDGTEGDGNDPYHTYEEPGVYVVCLYITDASGCVSEVCHEVHVEEPESDCHAAFTWDIDSLTVHFFSQSTSDHDIISTTWHFGDGTEGEGTNPIHTYEQPGVYVVCIRIEDNTGCVSELCHEVHVGVGEEECHAQFTWEQIPGTLQIHFNSTSTSEFDIVSYSWQFGDGTEGDGNDPYHTYEEPGTYLVCLVITDASGCVSDVCHEVVVVPISSEECNASFSFETDDEGVVYFNNNSTGGTEHTTWFWDFDDGETSTDENPYHVYEEPGIYTVCLTMADSTLNCSDLFCLTMTVGLQWEESHYDQSRTPREMADNIASPFEEGKKVIRYTNPVMDEIFLEYFVEIASPVAIEIFDLSGYRLMADYSALTQEGVQQKRLDVSHLQPGMYLLSITTGTQRKTMGITISR